MKIGIDIMGSDQSPHLLFDAVLQAAQFFNSSHNFVVFTTEEAYQKFSVEQKKQAVVSSIDFHFCTEMISMRDEPISAIRQKKNASLVLGIKALKKKTIDSFVSCGNTGALFASSLLTLSSLKGIRRPALMALLPSEKGSVAVLDVGGNLQWKAEDLIRYALMGSAFVRTFLNISHPKVGLLNIGAESKKGTLALRLSYDLLQKHVNHFVGNIEGRETFFGKVDVLVTDAFTGNILLKASEGTALFILDLIKKGSPQHSSLAHDLHNQLSYNEFPGAILLGVNGIVVKCHGDSTARGLFNGIKACVNYAAKDLIGQLKKELSNSLPKL